MKKYILFIISLTLLCSCNQQQEKILTFEEMLSTVTTTVDDTTTSISQLDNILPMFLDSLEEEVNTSSDADDRYEIRRFASVLVERIKQVRTTTEYLYFIEKYQKQLQKIIHSWYVEKMADNEDGTPAYIISHAAPTKDGRIGLTFAVGSTPILVITLPHDAITHCPLILFESQDGEKIKSSQAYCPETKNLSVFGDNDSEIMLWFNGDEWINDLLNYEWISIAYFNKNTYNYSNITDAINSGECVNNEQIFLFDLQEKYKNTIHQ